MDQYCRLSERRGTTYDPKLDAGASHLHVPARTARRNGAGQRRLGRVSDKIWRADYNALFGSSSDRGIGYGSPFSAHNWHARNGVLYQ